MTPSKESSPPSEGAAAPTPTQPETARERLAALLKEGESPTPPDTGESQPSVSTPAEPQGKPKVLKDLAERLKLEDADLYAIEVPMSNGKAMSLGALKDAAAKSEEHTVRELAFEERVAKQEAEWTRSQTELTELVSLLGPAAVKPELKAKIAAKVAADTQRERELIMRSIPEWQNETVREAELAGMVEHLRDYGISESFLAQPNHKLFRLVRDSYLRKARVERALKQVEEVRRPSTTGKSNAGNGAPRRAPESTPPRKESARDRLSKALAS